jgi:hypothetical protein
MPMIYAHQPDVLAHLKIAGADVAAIDRVTRLENALVIAFDHLTGTSYGTAPLAETRIVDGRTSSVLVLSPGVVSVSGVRADNGIWDGTTWTGLTALDPDEYFLTFTDADGVSYGLERVGGSVWVGPVAVTAVWSDQGAGGVPPDVREALTLLTVKEYRRLHTSPSEQIGPEGQVVPAPSGWNDPSVQRAIDAHRIVRVIV